MVASTLVVTQPVFTVLYSIWMDGFKNIHAKTAELNTLFALSSV